jgi:hypothetical protein
MRKALIVVESMFGNTMRVAEAVAEGLSEHLEPEVVLVSEASQPRTDLHLLVVGGPTHAFGMTRQQTRSDAVKQGAPPAGTEGGGIREWIASLPHGRGEVAVATFDTKIAKARRIPGSAAHGAARALRRRGYRLVSGGESFYVDDVKGPLLDGELDRARRWGAQLGRIVQKSAGRAESA